MGWTVDLLVSIVSSTSVKPSGKGSLMSVSFKSVTTSEPWETEQRGIQRCKFIQEDREEGREKVCTELR